MLDHKTKILLIDDHPLVRLSLGQLIEEQDDLMVCGEADNAREALQCVVATNPDLAIVDLSLPGGSGLELIRLIQGARPNVRMIVLSMHDEKIYAERAIRAGARGYVMKHEAADRIIEAIYSVRGGKLALSKAIEASLGEKYGEGRLPPPGPSVERLSDRELEIFEALGTGTDTKSIANELGISMKTVQAHCANIKTKLELENATELLREAMRWSEFQSRQ